MQRVRHDAPVVVEVAVVQVQRRIGSVQKAAVAKTQGPFEPLVGPDVAQLVGIGQVALVKGRAEARVHRGPPIQHLRDAKGRRAAASCFPRHAPERLGVAGLDGVARIAEVQGQGGQIVVERPLSRERGRDGAVVVFPRPGRGQGDAAVLAVVRGGEAQLGARVVDGGAAHDQRRLAFGIHDARPRRGAGHGFARQVDAEAPVASGGGEQAEVADVDVVALGVPAREAVVRDVRLLVVRDPGRKGGLHRLLGGEGGEREGGKGERGERRARVHVSCSRTRPPRPGRRHGPLPC